MKKAIVLDANDIKKLLAEKYNVEESQIIKSQYSYVIEIGDCEDKNKS